MTRRTSLLSLTLSAAIFGTIGIFRRWLPLPSGVLAMLRGFLGAASMALILLLRRGKPAWKPVRENLVKLLVSGAMIGFNWILLFEAYRYTTVAVATLCYYMAPIFVLLVSPLLLKEKLTARKGICVLAALAGMVLVSGVVGGENTVSGRGVLLGLGAAALYAAVVLTNKTIRGVPAIEKTAVQLFSAGAVLIPYVLLAEEIPAGTFTGAVILLTLAVGLVHTGLAYALYFGSMDGLSAQTVALFSYIDPVVAVLLSALLLREPMGAWEAVGTVLVIGAAAVSELPGKPHPTKEDAR